jgi:hypothetical protein
MVLPRGARDISLAPDIVPLELHCTDEEGCPHVTKLTRGQRRPTLLSRARRPRPPGRPTLDVGTLSQSLPLPNSWLCWTHRS